MDKMDRAAFGEDTMEEGKESNFTAQDLEKLNRMRDVGQMKEYAMSLISNTEGKYPMKPEKVAWFDRAIDKMTRPDQVIKLMYDLLLSGEGFGVIGSKSSTRKSSYRAAMGESGSGVENMSTEKLKKILAQAEDEVTSPPFGHGTEQKDTMEEHEVMEGFGSMTGSAKTSYQALENVKLVVKHKKAVNEESRGSRSRNIHSIYIQRGEERFRVAENNLTAARALARHLTNGGEMFDSIGEAIVEMASEQRKLKEFVRYVNKAGIVNEGNTEYVQLAVENANRIKNTLNKICGVKTYARAVESLQDMAGVEMLEDDLDLDSKFRETRIDSRVEEAFDGLKKSVARRRAFEGRVESAVAKESFSTLKSMLSEDDALEYSTPHAHLSHQVSMMSRSAADTVLQKHLSSISQKIAERTALDSFEYRTLQNCLHNVHAAPVAGASSTDISESYVDFLNSFTKFNY